MFLTGAVARQCLSGAFLAGQLKHMDRKYLVFDVESIGLHGEGFAVAGGVYSAYGGVALYEFHFACPMEDAAGEDADREWVRKNVPPLDVTHTTRLGVLNAFWGEWLLLKKLYPGIVMAAECGWPVEAKFLMDCVARDPMTRNMEGPYPLHEIATYMAAAGMDPMATYDRKSRELPKHDPLADARQSARLLCEALDILSNDSSLDE